MSNWEGKERRAHGVQQMNQDDRDRFIRIEEYSKQFQKWAEEHDKKDDARYEEFKLTQKVVYMAIGVAAFIKFFIK